MFYIRTEKNIYGLDIVIDVSDNKDFVKTSGLSWVEIQQEEPPAIGMYYYEGKFISIDSEDYKIIEDIIFEFEEPKRIEREKEEQRLLEEYQERIQKEMEELELEELPPPPEPITIEEIKEKIENIPKPVAKPIEDVESTQENYEQWTIILKNLECSISAYDSGNYSVEDDIVVIFNPPIEFPNGITQEQTILPPSMTIEDQIEHLKENKNYVLELIERIKTDLKITD
jgi:hypothetical protein